MLRWVFLPAVNQVFHHPPLPRLRVQRIRARVDEVIRDPDKRLRPRPMAGHVADIQLTDRVGRNAFALHLVNQRGQTVGQVKQRGPRGQIRLLFQAAWRSVASAPTCVAAAGMAGGICARSMLSPRSVTSDNRGKQASWTLIEQIADAARHAPGVHDKLHPGQGLGRVFGAALSQPIHQRFGESPIRVERQRRGRGEGFQTSAISPSANGNPFGPAHIAPATGIGGREQAAFVLCI